YLRYCWKLIPLVGKSEVLAYVSDVTMAFDGVVLSKIRGYLSKKCFEDDAHRTGWYAALSSVLAPRQYRNWLDMFAAVVVHDQDLMCDILGEVWLDVGYNSYHLSGPSLHFYKFVLLQKICSRQK